MSVSFRQVDIDRFDPDSPVNNLPEITPSGVTLDEVKSTGQTVRSHLSSGDSASALKASLASPPYGSDAATKDAALDNVLQVLSTTRVSEIDNLLQQLTAKEHVVLVKYLYKASASNKGKLHGAALLNWMERTFAVAGQGAIIKHMTDRHTV